MIQKWLRLFFIEDASLYSYPIAELQLRAAWIGFALILQTDNEIDHNLYVPHLMPFGPLIPLALILGSFFAMWMAFNPNAVQSFVRLVRCFVLHLQVTLLVSTLIVATVGASLLANTVAESFSPPQLVDDGTSLDTNAALLLLHGRNPYTDSSILDVAQHFSIQPTWTTPLRRGRFANRLDYPTAVELQTVFNADRRTGYASEFESKVSYPALSFLIFVPFVLLQNYNVLLVSLLSYLLLVTIAWKVIRPELRPWLLLLSIANVPTWVSITTYSLDIFYALLIVLVWLRSGSRWSSGLLLGLALADKQTAWLFAPFYAVLIWRRHGLKEAIFRLSIAGGLALAINIPFIVWNPQAWVLGVFTPVADPMFPLGVGLIGLSITHLLPFFPVSVYLILEVCVMLLSLIWYWRICPKRPEAAMLLAVIPLLFAWRSLPSYFSYAAYQLFILMSVKTASDPHTLSVSQLEQLER